MTVFFIHDWPDAVRLNFFVFRYFSFARILGGITCERQGVRLFSVFLLDVLQDLKVVITTPLITFGFGHPVLSSLDTQASLHATTYDVSTTG